MKLINLWWSAVLLVAVSASSSPAKDGSQDTSEPTSKEAAKDSRALPQARSPVLKKPRDGPVAVKSETDQIPQEPIRLTSIAATSPEKQGNLGSEALLKPLLSTPPRGKGPVAVLRGAPKKKEWEEVDGEESKSGGEGVSDFAGMLVLGRSLESELKEAVVSQSKFEETVEEEEGEGDSGPKGRPTRLRMASGLVGLSRRRGCWEKIKDSISSICTRRANKKPALTDDAAADLENPGRHALEGGLRTPMIGEQAAEPTVPPSKITKKKLLAAGAAIALPPVLYALGGGEGSWEFVKCTVEAAQKCYPNS